MMIMTKEEIEALVKKRSKILDIDYDSKEADEIKDKIIECFKSNFDNYSEAFILETFTKFGFSPSILYDDNGFWIIQDTGFQSMPVDEDGNEGIVENMTFVIEDKEGWKPTIREALRFWIDVALNTSYE